jgi:2,3-bisphosphoglycerate-independent phosphoglycerate mutase
MKWAIIIPDGCADLPVEALQGKTSLQVANIPAMRQIAQQGLVGATEQHAASSSRWKRSRQHGVVWL